LVPERRFERHANRVANIKAALAGDHLHRLQRREARQEHDGLETPLPINAAGDQLLDHRHMMRALHRRRQRLSIVVRRDARDRKLGLPDSARLNSCRSWGNLSRDARMRARGVVYPDEA
jgi:hypothetical protein